MRLQPLGKTALRVPPVCLGTYTLATTWPVDLDRAKAALRHGVDNGLTLVDSAHAYGPAERILGEVFADELRNARDRLIICTKAGLVFDENATVNMFAPNSRPEFLRACAIESLRRLGTDHLDIFLVHWFDPEVPIAEVADAMLSLRNEGLVRHIGVSNYTTAQMDAFRARATIEVIQVPYSLFCRGIEGEILGYAQTHGIGVMGYAGLATGYLSGTFGKEPQFPENDWRHHAVDFTGERYRARVAAAAKLTGFAREKDCTLPELAVAWVAASQIPVVPLVGVQAPAHVDSILRAMTIGLTAAEVQTLRSIAAEAPEMDYLGLVT